MKQQEKYSIMMSLSCLLSTIFLGGLTSFLLLYNGPLSLVLNRHAGIKVCIIAVSIQNLFTLLVKWMYQPESYKSRPHFSTRVVNVIKCLGILFLASFVFHIISVCFGAPFFESSALTFHFAILLTVQVCLPFCLFLGLDMEAWLNIFIEQNHNEPEEVQVFFTSICSIVGAWLGAVPIPLDWDRPWQVWPISCVTGAMVGYSCGLLLSSISILRLRKTAQKSKFF